jgi:TonB family protein
MKLKALLTLASLLAIRPLQSQDEAKSPAQEGEQIVLRVGKGVLPPRVISKVDPSYSKLAMAAWYSGTVVVQIVVGSGGVPRDFRILRSLGLGLDEKALEAVKQWGFQPGTKEGQPVNVLATIEVNFRMGSSSVPHWRLSRVAFHSPQHATAPALVEYKHPQAHLYKNPGDWLARIEFDVDEQGRVQNSTIGEDPIQPAGPGIESAMKKDVLTAAKHWRFTPAQESGKAVSSTAAFDFIWSASGN